MSEKQQVDDLTKKAKSLTREMLTSSLEAGKAMTVLCAMGDRQAALGLTGGNELHLQTLLRLAQECGALRKKGMTQPEATELLIKDGWLNRLVPIVLAQLDAALEESSYPAGN